MDTANAASHDPGPSADRLSDRDREVLDFERQWWKYAGAKEQAVNDSSTCPRPATTRCSTR